MHTLTLWSSPTYIAWALANTMSQNHTSVDGILGWDQIIVTALNIVVQYQDPDIIKLVH